ncbi:unnamed protein product [Gadus morhua 'NCC']
MRSFFHQREGAPPITSQPRDTVPGTGDSSLQCARDPSSRPVVAEPRLVMRKRKIHPRLPSPTVALMRITKRLSPLEPPFISSSRLCPM